MTTSTMSPILRKILKICVPIAVYILVWQLLSMFVDSSLLLPSPKETVRSIISILGTASGWCSIGATILRILCGFLLGCFIGLVLAVMTAKCKWLAWLLQPLRSIIKTTPITSFALILLISLVSGLVPVAVSAIVVVPMIWRTTEESILALDPKLAEMGRIFLSPWKHFRYVSLPQILPQFFATASTALGFAWKAVITAEILALPKAGIGNQMYLNKVYLDSADLFAWTLLVIVCSVSIETLVAYLLQKAGKERHD